MKKHLKLLAALLIISLCAISFSACSNNSDGDTGNLDNDAPENPHPVWSAFAPIHDSEGNIVAILGIDYPAEEIIDYPEWNRDEDAFVEDADISTMPDVVANVANNVTTLARENAETLDGDFGDKHVAVVEAGGDSTDVAELTAVLDAIRVETGALYVYTLADFDTTDGAFNIVIDGSIEPDDYGNPYDTESQFETAIAGTPAPAPSAWND